jgi:digeranylgeranylglycerophospholipid reductase
MMWHDIIVVGAGPAGSRIAQRLSRLGYSVVVVEKNLRPGDGVCCTGVLSQECLDAFGLDNDLILRQANSARLLSPSGEYLRLSRQSPVAAVVDRVRLNIHMVEAAEASGARYLFGTRANDVLARGDSVAVSVSGQSEKKVLQAKAAVIATGFGSTLPAKLGLGEIKQFVLGAQVQVAVNGIDEVEVYIDQKLTPGGFAWLVPTTEGRGLVGLLTRDRADSALEKLLKLLSTGGKIAPDGVAPGYDVVPLKPLPRTYADRLLVVGEVAGQVKPTTGGGVYYGLLCADIAAGVLQRSLEADDFSARALSSYEKEWRARLNREMVIGYWARNLLAKLSNDKIDRLFRLADKEGLPELISNGNGFSFDWHSHLLLKMAGSILPF